MASHDQVEMSCETARFLLDTARATFLDVRPSTDYEASGLRIPGALQVGSGSGVDILEALKAAPTDRALVVYCDDADQATSALVAGRARELGLAEAYFLAGGFSAWQARRLPVERIPDVAVAPEPQPGG